jgi:membrane-associated phospholipid phosphatase
MLALVNVAIYDATIAAWDTKYAYTRPRPSDRDTSLPLALAAPAGPSYPSEHAVAAGAASTVLAYLFPKAAAFFQDKAKEAAQSRMLAGLHYRSDVEAGLRLGRAVATRVIAWAKTDGSDAVWNGKMPVGPGIWHGTPAEPLMGNWKTWVLTSGSEFRPGPPPAYNSAQCAAEVAAVKNYKRDVNPGVELTFWPEDPAGRPPPDTAPISSNQIVFYYAPLLHFTWQAELNRKLFEYRLDSNPPRAARAYALLSIAGHDSTVASWNGKFHYWAARPDQFDPTITTVLPTYAIPDYPGGHATTGAATETMPAYLFPNEASYFQSRAAELAASRIWAGIHFPSAEKAGLALGDAVSRKIIAHAQADGS